MMERMKRCKTCRHFEPDAASPASGALCRRIEALCYETRFQGMDVEITTMGDGGLDVYVPEDFGCTEHEPRDDNG